MTSTPGRGLIAAGHPAAADAAATAAEAGGNAFDAVLAAGFASSVCEPGFTSLAGGGFLLARTAGGTEVVFDFFVDTPGRGLDPDAVRPAFEEVAVTWGAAEQRFGCGLGSVAVPGNLAGYLHVHGRLGRLALADVVAPAVSLARQGVQVPATQAADFRLLAPILQRTPEARAIFAPRGRLLDVGDVLVNRDLADFLERLGGNAEATFFRGPLAAALAGQMESGAGLVTAEDLAAYRVVERAPLVSTYRGRRVLSNPPPSLGGSLIALALGWLDQRGPLPAAGSPELAVTLARLMAEVDAHRRSAPRGDDDVPDRPVATRGTTHVSVANTDGNVAAMTTSNGECSGDVIAGTGILLNNMLGEDDLHPAGFHAAPAGTRVASMMSPTLVLDADGHVELAIGSGGSKRIRSALLQVLVGVIDHARPLADAVESPRLHWDTDHLEVEPGFADPVIEALRSLGPVNLWPERSMYFGGTHAVQPGRAAAGDPRRGGAARDT